MRNWVAAGQAADAFPRVTLREMSIIIDAASLRDARLAWQVAQYACFAYHSPNDMPPAPDYKPKPGVTSQADDAYVRAWMRAMHNRSRMQ